MKFYSYLFMLLCLFGLSTSAFAQVAPDAFSYQAVVRDANGAPMTTTVTLRISILEGSDAGPVVYSETLPRTPNEFGIVTVDVGDLDSATFNTVEWRNFDHYLKVEMDAGSGFEDMGDPSQILAVPYAYASDYAEVARTDNDWVIDGQNLHRANGYVAVGHTTPSQPLDVQSEDNIAAAGVIRGTYTANIENDGVGVYGESTPTNYYGIGGLFEGGYRGVVGLCEGLEDDFYYGVYANSFGGTGTNYGVYTAASGGGTNYGIYSFVSSGYAGYFNGDVLATGEVNLGSSTLNGSSRVNVRSNMRIYNTSNNTMHYWTNSSGGAGYYEVFGPAGSRNLWISGVSGSLDHGYFGVCDANGTAQVGMFVNGAGDGILFKDVNNFRMDHPEMPDKEIWYAAIEGPEAGAYERGNANLENGEIFIPYSDHFTHVTNPSTVTVILTPNSANTYGLAVIEKTEAGFLVKELMNGTGNFSFDWEVKGVRKGYEDYEVIRDRMEFAPAEVSTEPFLEEESTLPRDPKLED